MHKGRIKDSLISGLGLNPGDFQKKPRIYDPLYLLHWAQLRLLKKFIQENINGRKNAVLLDLGCGIKPYKSLFEPYLSRYLGLDLSSNPQADIACLAESVSLPDQSCNVVLALQLLEHTEEPIKVLNEINRLLAKGGVRIYYYPGIFLLSSSSPVIQARCGYRQPRLS